MNYQEAIEYLDRFNIKGITPGLDSIRELMNRLYNCQDKLNVIHIAGTNGKGSVGEFIARVCANAGMLVGRYVSPAVFEDREIIRFYTKDEDFDCISEEEIIEFVERIKEFEDIQVSRFEAETAMAFYTFYKRKCDIVLVEVGMGGELDATNIISNPICSVITQISMDHMQFLGDTIEDIARNKAGIIKPNSPVVTISQSEEVMKVLEEKCLNTNSDMFVAKKDDIDNVKVFSKRTEFDYKKDGQKVTYQIPLLGIHQIENALIAIKTIEIISNSNVITSKISEEDIKNGLMDAKWPGRFERISDRPLIYVDGAHNEDAARRLSQCIDLYCKDNICIGVTGMFADKEVEKSAEIISEKLKAVVTFTIDNPRAMSSEELSEIYSQRVKTYKVNTLKQAIDKALFVADMLHIETKKKVAIIFFGSLSFMRELYGNNIVTVHG